MTKKAKQKTPTGKPKSKFFKPADTEPTQQPTNQPDPYVSSDSEDDTHYQRVDADGLIVDIPKPSKFVRT